MSVDAGEVLQQGNRWDNGSEVGRDLAKQHSIFIDTRSLCSGADPRYQGAYNTQALTRSTEDNALLLLLGATAQARGWDRRSARVCPSSFHPHAATIWLLLCRSV